MEGMSTGSQPTADHPEHHWLSDLRHGFASLIRFGAAPAPRWPLATQAALAVAVPIAVMTLLGRPELGYQAASGAFAALFASHLAAIDRVRVVPLVGVGLLTAAVLGALAGSSPVATIIGLVVVAIGSAALAFGFSLGPPGPLFFVLTFGLTAHISAAGADVLVYLSALTAGIVFAWLLTAAPLLRRRARRMPRHTLRTLLPGPAWPPAARILLLRVALVAVVGAAVGAWLDPERAYWVVGSAVAVIGIAADRRAAFSRGIHRMTGTVAGAGLFLLLAPLSPVGLWLALILGVLQFAIEIVVVRHYALALTFITPLVLLLTGAVTATVDSPAIASERIIDTMAGAVLGAITGVLHSGRRPM